MKNAIYETSLTDAQWAYLQPMLPKPAKRGRPPADRRRILDAILYVVKCGCPWRYLPINFPPWKTVYHIFRQWTLNHQWAILNDALRTLVRRTHDKRSRPTAAILDSQSVKSAGHGGSVGYDAGKRIKGRKRHLLVDTLGLVLGVVMTPANITERAGVQLLLGRVLGWFTWLRLLWVDGCYTGAAFAQWVKGRRPKLEVEVIQRSDTTKGFKVLARRWVVERTFGWLMHQRRLVRDYETTESSAVAWIYIAMIRIQLRRLA
ncbi:MAG TPA: IS5 family transposase [Verrucomicrobiae bacterium]